MKPAKSGNNDVGNLTPHNLIKRTFHGILVADSDISLPFSITAANNLNNPFRSKSSSY